MFGWVEDVVDWISSGVSDAWDNTVGTLTSEAARSIFDAMFNWIFMTIYNGIADIFTWINESSADLFDLAWIKAFISLFHNIGWILFACGMIVAVFDTAIGCENGRADIKGTCLNVLKGFFAASLITVVPQRLYSFSVSLQNTFAGDLVGALIQNRNASLTDSGNRLQFRRGIPAAGKTASEEIYPGTVSGSAAGAPYLRPDRRPDRHNLPGHQSR